MPTKNFSAGQLKITRFKLVRASIVPGMRRQRLHASRNEVVTRFKVKPVELPLNLHETSTRVSSGLQSREPTCIVQTRLKRIGKLPFGSRTSTGLLNARLNYTRKQKHVSIGLIYHAIHNDPGVHDLRQVAVLSLAQCLLPYRTATL
jgi:hypothetical protein